MIGPGDVAAVANLLSQVFGWAVDPNGYERLTLDNKLTFLMRGINAAVSKSDWPVTDALFAEYRELRQQHTA
jgi:hypothetical protein